MITDVIFLNNCFYSCGYLVETSFVVLYQIVATVFFSQHSGWKHGHNSLSPIKMWRASSPLYELGLSPVSLATKRMWQKQHCVTSKARSGKVRPLSPCSLRMPTLGEASHHVTSPGTPRLPCWRAHMPTP